MMWLVLLSALIGGFLYRLRGGLFADLMGWERAPQWVRFLVWALPTGVLATIAAGAPWWLAGPMAVAVHLSVVLLGHGAHMVMDAEQFILHSANKTELVTSWWLPKLFGGTPDESWLVLRPDDVTKYNVVGMSAIGLVRNTIAALPLFFYAPILGAAYATFGALHGALYWLGWRFDGSSDSQWGQNRAGEILVGALSWAFFAAALIGGA